VQAGLHPQRVRQSAEASSGESERDGVSKMRQVLRDSAGD